MSWPKILAQSTFPRCSLPLARQTQQSEGFDQRDNQIEKFRIVLGRSFIRCHSSGDCARRNSVVCKSDAELLNLSIASSIPIVTTQRMVCGKIHCPRCAASNQIKKFFRHHSRLIDHRCQRLALQVFSMPGQRNPQLRATIRFKM